MKRVLVAAMVVALSVAGMKAQDTIVFSVMNDSLPSNYGYSYWIDFDSASYEECGWGNSWPQQWANRVCVPEGEEMTVYGIAGSLFFFDDSYADTFYTHFTYDTTKGKVYEWLQLLVGCDDAVLCPVKSVKVLVDEPPAYYLDLRNEPHAHSQDIFPVYECYFQNPIVMTDTFWVGRTARTADADTVINGQLYERLYWSVMHLSLLAPFIPMPGFDYAYVIRPGGDWCINSERNNPYSQYAFFFPIIVPDTTGNPPGEEGIALQQMMERYVNVFPNPTMGQATVTSSFGIKNVEVIDATGRTVNRKECRGYSCAIDVSVLPQGQYTVRVSTYNGHVVSKTLLVQKKQ